jgi:hypothetical protein
MIAKLPKTILKGRKVHRDRDSDGSGGGDNEKYYSYSLPGPTSNAF